MGLEIDILWLTVLIFGSLAILLMAGLPLAVVTGGLACIFLFVFADAAVLNILPSRIFPGGPDLPRPSRFCFSWHSD